MAKLTDLRRGLASALDTIDGLTAHAFPPGSITPPAALVLPGVIEFDETMQRGADGFTFQVLVVVPKSDQELAQIELDEYCAGSGPKSVKEAIENHPTLGGACDWVRVTRMSSYGPEEINDVPHLGARFDVEVNADGN